MVIRVYIILRQRKEKAYASSAMKNPTGQWRHFTPCLYCDSLIVYTINKLYTKSFFLGHGERAGALEIYRGMLVSSVGGSRRLTMQQHLGQGKCPGPASLRFALFRFCWNENM